MAFDTNTIMFTDLFLPAMKGGGGWLEILRQASVGRLTASAGSVKARVTRAIASLATPVSGTILGNNANRDETALTAFTGVHTVELFDYETDQFNADPDAWDRERAAFLDKAQQQAQFEIITDLVAGSPDQNFSLPAGSIDGAWATDAARQNVLKTVDQAWSHVLMNTKGKAGQVFMVANKGLWAHLVAAVGQSGYGQFISAAPPGQFGGEPALLWHGMTPIFGYNGPNVSGFSGATGAADDKEDCLYVIHPDAQPFLWSGAMEPFPGLRYEPDGLFKHYYHAFGFTGLVQATHYAAVVNPST